MTDADFYIACSKLDWFACMSDDYSKLTTYRTALASLRKVATTTQLDALGAWVKWRDRSISAGRELPRPLPAAIPSIDTALHPQQTTIYDFLGA